MELSKVQEILVAYKNNMAENLTLSDSMDELLPGITEEEKLQVANVLIMTERFLQVGLMDARSGLNCVLLLGLKLGEAWDD